MYFIERELERESTVIYVLLRSQAVIARYELTWTQLSSGVSDTYLQLVLYPLILIKHEILVHYPKLRFVFFSACSLCLSTQDM